MRHTLLPPLAQFWAPVDADRPSWVRRRRPGPRVLDTDKTIWGEPDLWVWAIIAPQPCIRWIGADPDHDAVVRIGGEAPWRRRPSWHSASKPWRSPGYRHLGSRHSSRV